MRISDWSSDVCSSDLLGGELNLLVEARVDGVADLPGDGAVGHDRSSPQSFGRRAGVSSQGRAFSNAAAARNTLTSSKVRPTICNPVGTPLAANPDGPDMTGPERKSAVEGKSG